jgi:hypothetical protein
MPLTVSDGLFCDNMGHIKLRSAITMAAYLCVSIDCECDKGPGWRTQKPLAFMGIITGIGARLQPLFARFGAKPTYLLSPEVLRDDASLELLAALKQNAELGTHLHGEFAEPDAFEPDLTGAFQCHYDRDIEAAKLSCLTERYRSAFGRAPRSFRAGRFGIGPHSLGLLVQQGYHVDSSVTPHKDWSRAGAPEVSFLDAPTQPYWPVPGKPACPALSGTLLEVPVTIRPVKIPLLNRFLEPRWLRPTHTRAARLIALAQEEIKAAVPGRPAVLNCMFHNIEITAGTSPYAGTWAEADTILANLAGLLAWAQNHGISCIGLGDVPGLFVH